MQGCCNPRNSKMNLIAYILELLKVSFTNRNLRRIFWTRPDRDNLLGYARILSYYGGKMKLSRTVKTRFVVACWSKEQKYDFSILLSLQSPILPIDKLIFDWFYFGREKFIKHDCRNNKNGDNTIDSIILSHYKWLKNNNIEETPTYILNGERLSSDITILDIINAC